MRRRAEVKFGELFTQRRAQTLTHTVLLRLYVSGRRGAPLLGAWLFLTKCGEFAVSSLHTRTHSGSYRDCAPPWTSWVSLGANLVRARVRVGVRVRGRARGRVSGRD